MIPAPNVCGTRGTPKKLLLLMEKSGELDASARSSDPEAASYTVNPSS